MRDQSATVGLGGGAWADAFTAVGILLAAIALGVAVGTGHGMVATAALTVTGGVVLGAASWRRSLYGLLIYIPVSGVLIIATYPDTHVAVLLKDILFVVPAYLGFLAWASARRSAVLFPEAPIVLLVLLGLLVLVQAFNPSLPNLLVGAIGLKVWLLYVPLYFLGYHLIRNRSDLSSLFAVMSLGAVLPLVIGVIEAILIKGGHANEVYRWYGPAAASVTQDFARFDYVGGGTLRRVPSTFSFVTQYYTFAASMVVVIYAWWRGALVGTARSTVGLALWLLVLAATFLSGARGAFLLIPLLVLLILVLDHRPKIQLSGRMLAPFAALLGAFTVLGVAAPDVIGATVHTAILEFEDVFVNGFRQAISATWFGLGTGIDTSATRYAYSETTLFQGVGGTWYESWWVKAVLELGVPGLILVCCLFGTILIRGLRSHRALRDPRLRAISASLIAFVIWNLAYALKGQYLDFDPINIYFWLFAGVLARLPSLDTNSRAHEAERL